jgi:hypothetical protein
VGTRARKIDVAAAGLATFLGLGALLTGCGGSSDNGGSRPSATAPGSVVIPSAGDNGTLRKPTSPELDSTWFPDHGTDPLGILHSDAMMPTVNQCDGTVTFAADVTISFPCGTDRAHGTLRLDPSGDTLTIAWTGGPTDTFTKRPDLTAPQPTLTGVPSMEDLQRQLDELADLTDNVAGGLTGG